MSNIGVLIEEIQSGLKDTRFLEIYVDAEALAYQKERYIRALYVFREQFGDREVAVFSAPGRSEIGGNHTDHQRGKVLVASVDADAIGIVHKTKENKVCILSEGYALMEVCLDDLEAKKEEEGTTLSLVKGVLWEMKRAGYTIGGFCAYITSDVLIGAGLSSSAAFETLLGTIISHLFNGGGISPIQIAKVGQAAENMFFGKPCGLMDQMASSVGNLVYIDFAQETEPEICRIDCDFEQFGYSLCITDTKSSHADCTPEYAAVPHEMKDVAAVFGKDVLRDVTKEMVLGKLELVRQRAGDRALLRALHFILENERVENERTALLNGDFEGFLKQVLASGNSSFKYLQNVYIPSDVEHQNISLALLLSDMMLGGDGVSRVHGGGFAGTIQAFVKNDKVKEYIGFMNGHFGDKACKVYKIRRFGGMKVW